MTSDAGQGECFVYITLPGETEPVTAARFTLSSDRAGNVVGRLRYGRSYLQRDDCVALDPLELKLAARTYRITAGRGVPGALRDAGPDNWGRRVIERHTGKPDLGEIDYLLHSPDDRAGALGFGLGTEPPAPRRTFNRTLDLGRLQAIADAIVRDGEIPPGATAGQVDDLLLMGTSMGGARPKAVIEDDDGLWVAKFNRPDDRWNHARVEHAMLLLAQECGIAAAHSRVAEIGGRDLLLVKRFDREKTEAGYLRSRMVSGLTLLRADDAANDRGKWSYPLLVEELRRVSAQPRQDAFELFRRMCLNAMISNTDDHPRNHAVIAKAHDWKLSPAYDITPFPHVSIERRDLALICGDAGRYANAANLLSQCERFLLSRTEGRALMETMAARVRSQWYGVARGAGVSEADCERIRSAFLYDGFFHPEAA